MCCSCFDWCYCVWLGLGFDGYLYFDLVIIWVFVYLIFNLVVVRIVVLLFDSLG